ncbi:NudC domain-containing protein 2 [Monoraphidium neglectum]|uniref:NudC domain-containing protein 2 n=1 Tax=Monoraphidium neglectum TaxID=145388 RepID=A0A0D2N1Y8_9CHLO|nr:NudC domain-containing protein 2 [Monoraphidium neglectum]KIZ06512.1 NudC domain-containing protein 2 [Monoraphidium neglectum]|eukprot:XP_013905531.1 NudC domain-containing protein 2 [Monoraphidium neglectum]
MAERLAPSERHRFVHGGRTIYEWDQSLAEVNMYVEVPPGVRARDMFCEIAQRHIKFGLKGNPPFLDLDLTGPVKVSESMWTLEDGELHITLTKLEQGDPWPSAIKGHEVDIMTQQAEQQRLMLERFQREHPGFDFSQAKFNGEAPNPRTFLGGMGATG